jgi:hypothetical protein
MGALDDHLYMLIPVLRHNRYDLADFFKFQYPPQEIIETFGPRIAKNYIPHKAYPEPTYLGGGDHVLNFDIMLTTYGQHGDFKPLFRLIRTGEQTVDEVHKWIREKIINYPAPQNKNYEPHKLLFIWGKEKANIVVPNQPVRIRHTMFTPERGYTIRSIISLSLLIVDEASTRNRQIKNLIRR